MFKMNKSNNKQVTIRTWDINKKQGADLENQIESLKQFCFSKGSTVNGVYKDIASDISF